MGTDREKTFDHIEDELELEQYGVWVKTGPEEIPLEESDSIGDDFDLEDLDIPQETSISDISEEEEQLLGNLEEDELGQSDESTEEVFDLDFDEELDIEESSLGSDFNDLEEDIFSIESGLSSETPEKEEALDESIDFDVESLDELDELDELDDLESAGEEKADSGSYLDNEIEDIDLDQLDLEAEAILSTSEELPNGEIESYTEETESVSDSPTMEDSPFSEIDDISIDSIDTFDDMEDISVEEVPFDQELTETEPETEPETELSILPDNFETEIEELDLDSLDQEDFGEELQELEEIDLNEPEVDTHDKLTEFDDLTAFEEDFEEISADDTDASVHADEAAAGETDGTVLSKIEKELLSIKDELTSLRKELSVLRSRDTETPTGTREASSYSDGSEDLLEEDENAGFFADDEDETIALTGDELDNILNTADITEEESDTVISGETENSSDDTDIDDFDFSDLEISEESESEAEPPQSARAELGDELSEDLDDLEDLNDLEDLEAEPGIEELDLSELENIETGEEGTGVSEDLSEELDLSDLESADETGDEAEEEPGEPEELIEELEDFDLESLEEEEPDTEQDTEIEELDLSDLEPVDKADAADAEEEAEELEEFDLADFEEEEKDDTIGESDIDFEDLESPEEELASDIDFEEDELTVPDYSEELLVDKEDIIPMGNDDGSEDDAQSSSSILEPEVSEPAEMMPIDIELPEMQEFEEEEEEEEEEAKAEDETENTDISEEIPSQLRDEIKSVLSYMDHLLESLPEDKIEEFANSEHFNVYKRLFSELGLNS